MLTYDKIMEVFQEYLSEDKSCEVLHTRYPLREKIPYSI